MILMCSRCNSKASAH